jgi:hypothetical protein
VDKDSEAGLCDDCTVVVLAMEDSEFATKITRTRRSPRTPQSPPCCLHLLLSTEYSGDNLGWGWFLKQG